MAKKQTTSKKIAAPATPGVSPPPGATTPAREADTAAAPPAATPAVVKPPEPLTQAAPALQAPVTGAKATAGKPTTAATTTATPAPAVAAEAPPATPATTLTAEAPPATPAPAVAAEAPSATTAAGLSEQTGTPTAAMTDAQATAADQRTPQIPAAAPPTALPDTAPATSTAQDEAPPTTAHAQSPTEPPEPIAAPTAHSAAEHPVLEAAPAVASAPALSPDHPPAQRAQRPSLFIVHISPEMAPVAKVGGLADVVFGITREHAIRGNHVEIILPKYNNLRYDQIFELHEVYKDLWVPWYTGAIHCTVYFGFVHGRKCFFIEPHSQENFFNRGTIYGFADDVLRFAFFSRAAIEFLWKAGKHPDIIHCHDWQSALVPVFLYEVYQQLGMTHPRACLTIHNFMHQGLTGIELLRATGLHRPDYFLDWLRMGDNNHKNALNLLKAGIVYSNFITTVSPRYAFETKDQGQGFGLEPTLHVHHMKYGGILNGIDYDVWNPEVDHEIPVRYGVDNLDAKYDNKRALRHRLMLADNDKPIVAFIGRLDPQKGLGLVRHAIFYSLERGAQFVLLGSSPDRSINDDFWGLKRMLNDSPDCHLEIGFDEGLAHLIYAGADMMLVPSQFEPCGLTQLISLRYGTVPVVRTVGGLADTVFDKDHSDRPLHQRNGYRFDHYDGPGLESALGRAIDCYYEYPQDFRSLMMNGMRADYSWNQPGEDYLNIYDFIRAR